ncbi:DUF1254 domain-containing protein [Pseudomonas sp. GD03860]|uniref:DUF1254 domain-containing protein n=1 Tax=Pseudomonas TaxID=286 RepID=UPI0023646A9E|nr:MULTISPECIES: DUF1254 domain-containing protein [Pseudomonas]MDD2058524.1 DUF1254 domain-containing protein [Pseudomonas putida]MDH0640660.1 DUF1254 domain-containing protein [Pseudomonas sp. GD03860]
MKTTTTTHEIVNTTPTLRLLVAALALAGCTLVQAQTQTPVSDAQQVTVDNFTRAESARFFANVVKRGGFGAFAHHRQLLPIDMQAVVRPNRDTLYSSAVFDLDAGPVTVTLPDAGKRYFSMIAINQQQYTPGVVYKAGSYTYDKAQLGSRYLLLGVRTLVDPADPADVKAAHALQDAIKVRQDGGPGHFEPGNWDQASLAQVRKSLLALASTVPDSGGMFGSPAQVDPIRHLLGSAAAWGGNPEKDAYYLNVTPTRNDGSTVHQLVVRDVPVDAFWSISVYDSAGYFQKNPFDAYTLNNLTASKGADGSVKVRFGGCDGKVANCLPTMPGWNYMVRLYLPQAQILDGSWRFPQAQPLP